MKIEGIEWVPEEGGIATKLSDPKEVSMSVMHEDADKQIEAARKYRCDIPFASIFDLPIDPKWLNWEIGKLKGDSVKMTVEGGQKNGEGR